MKSIIILCFAILLTNRQACKDFVEQWNSKTKEYCKAGYLLDYEHNADSLRLKKMMFNRLSTLDVSSTVSQRRELFRKTIFPLLNEYKTFYIVEFIKSGEQLRFENLFVSSVGDVYSYYFSKDSWAFKNKYTIDPQYCDKLFNQSPRFGLGNNPDDIVIIYYHNKVVDVKYYLYSSINVDAVSPIIK